MKFCGKMSDQLSVRIGDVITDYQTELKLFSALILLGEDEKE